MEEEDDWSEEGDTEEAVCLFSDERGTVKHILEHMREKHGFTWGALHAALPGGLDDYAKIKVINYCRTQKEIGANVTLEMLSASPPPWLSDAFLQPVLENDALLFADIEIDTDGATAGTQAVVVAEETSVEDLADRVRRFEALTANAAPQPDPAAASLGERDALLFRLRQLEPVVQRMMANDVAPDTDTDTSDGTPVAREQETGDEAGLSSGKAGKKGQAKEPGASFDTACEGEQPSPPAEESRQGTFWDVDDADRPAFAKGGKKGQGKGSEGPDFDW
jgi:hypothetical protein